MMSFVKQDINEYLAMKLSNEVTMRCYGLWHTRSQKLLKIISILTLRKTIPVYLRMATHCQATPLPFV